MTRKGKTKRRTRKADSSREWYTLRPFSLALAVGYLLVLLIKPLVLPTAGHAGKTFVLVAVAAMLTAWFAWRLIRYSDRVANVVFCAVIGAGFAWSVLLSTSQRDAAAGLMERTVGQRVELIGDRAREGLAKVRPQQTVEMPPL